MDNLDRLSKEISYALRHAPWEYELEMDEEGWVPLIQLLEALGREAQWEGISQADVEEMIAQSAKKRFEIREGRIRAFYGHSFPMRIRKKEQEPPAVLYHGTARRFFTSIMENGLLPQERQYVHLSQDVETAEAVGKRHDGKPCILIIDAKKAWDEGIKFYFGNEKVWLADLVPGKYIEQMQREQK